MQAMKSRHLRAIEPLLRNAHELAIDAQEAAKEGRDAVLQHRCTALAKLISAELTTVRANIKAKTSAKRGSANG
jgi:hypothetical protein